MTSNSIALRTCLDCEKKAFTTADLAEFVAHPPSKYGHQNMCRICSSARSWAWQIANRERQNKTRREKYARKRGEQNG